jgi:alpha-tubulin suppressor-like RCC1 family protein
MKHSSFVLLGLFTLAPTLLAGCPREISCGPFFVAEGETCACPPGTTYEMTPTRGCRVPDGGLVTFDDAGPVDATVGIDAPMDAPGDAGVDAFVAADACVLRRFYRDEDGDTFGNAAMGVDACAAESGYVANADDCNDACPTCHPGGTETCDGLDNDCVAGVDNGVLTTFYRDVDMDTFGNAAVVMQACAAPAGFVANATDCNDMCAACRPGGVEVCEAGFLDEDCNGTPNDGCSCVDGTMMSCGSSVGECRAGTQTCSGGSWGACTGATGPVAETCDGLDQNCNASLDDGATCSVPTGALTAACLGGGCRVGACAAGRADCDATYGNGCEATLGTAATCAACGDTCGWYCGGAGCDDAIDIAVGNQHSCAVHESGRVSCWGDDFSNQLGRGAFPGVEGSASPVAVLTIASAAAVRAGSNHTCVLRSDRTVACWGANGSGQLGDGTTSPSRATPVVVLGISTATAVAAGDLSTCALLADNSVRCWGANNLGQLGDSTTTQRPSPTAIPGLSATALAMGRLHGCVINGTALRCWGSNLNGAVGDGTTATRLSAVTPIGMGSGTLAMALGSSHTCVLRAGGTVSCWGANGSGQVGDGTLTQRLSPTPVPGLSGVTAIWAGSDKSCARLGSGAVWCWGGGYGASPVAVPEHLGVSALSFGAHSCLVAAGRPRCRGANASGQLGDGSMSSSVALRDVLAPM